MSRRGGRLFVLIIMFLLYNAAEIIQNLQKLCSCYSSSAGDKSAFKVLRNENDASTVLCCCCLSLFKFSAISSTSNSDPTMLILFHTTTLKDPWRPPGHQWHTLELSIWPEYSSTLFKHQSCIGGWKCANSVSHLRNADKLPVGYVYCSCDFTLPYIFTQIPT